MFVKSDLYCMNRPQFGWIENERGYSDAHLISPKRNGDGVVLETFVGKYPNIVNIILRRRDELKRECALEIQGTGAGT